MANQLLYPVDTETRRKISLDGLWKFAFDPENKGTTENWSTGLKKAEWMPVPSSFNDLYAEKSHREYTGIVWYEKELIVPQEWKEKDLDLRFGSVTHQATVYINGIEAGRHAGGYTPFNIPIQELISFEQKNTVVVRVSNELSEMTLPAGSASKNLKGEQVTITTTDFFNYSGIQRSVYLVATPKESIEDISLAYSIDFSENKAEIRYNVTTASRQSLYLDIYNRENLLVASAQGKEGVAVIEGVHLWQPLNAYLYTFKWSLKDAEDLLDVYIDEVGIRTVETRGQQLLINGEATYLKGYVKPEHSELHGAASNLAVLKRDFELMKWSGANAFRTDQFPHDEEVYRLADREGFIVINEMPAIGMTSPKPNYFQPDKGKGVKPFFERDSVQTATKAHHLVVLKEWIQRDKNHASVCLWAVMEEPDTASAEFQTYAAEIIAAAKTLDPQTRPTTILFGTQDLQQTPQLADLVDVVAVNEYYGWEDLGGYELSDAEEELNDWLKNWTQLNKPMVITGYGSEALQGEAKLPSVQWSENYQIEVFQMQHRLFDAYPFIRGELVWSFSDYQTPEGLTAVDGNNSGVFTQDRQPKNAAYLLKNRWKTLTKTHKRGQLKIEEPVR